MQYKVTLTDRVYYEVEIEAEDETKAQEVAESIDWNFLIDKGAEDYQYADGLELESVEEV